MSDRDQAMDQQIEKLAQRMYLATGNSVFLLRWGWIEMPEELKNMFREFAKQLLNRKNQEVK